VYISCQDDTGKVRQMMGGFGLAIVGVIMNTVIHIVGKKTFLCHQQMIEKNLNIILHQLLMVGLSTQKTKIIKSDIEVVSAK